MPLWINDSSTWRSMTQVWANDSGTWRNIQQLWVNDSGTWRLVFNAFSVSAAGTAPLTKSQNAANITSNGIIATVTGGSGTFTYLWSIVTHDDPNSTPVINNSTTSACTVTTNENPTLDHTISVTVKCTVTDTVFGQVLDTNTVTISHLHTDFT